MPKGMYPYMRNGWDDPQAAGDYLARRHSWADYIEGPAVRSVLPDLSGMRVLDLGTGGGEWALWCAESGAESVEAVDRSPAMLAHAPVHPRIRWIQADMQTVQYPDACFDCVVSGLAFHYVEDYPGLMMRIARWLKPGGCLVFTVEHPLKYANTQGTWLTDEDGNTLAWPIDCYLDTGPRVEERNGLTWTKWHRTIGGYVEGVLLSGLKLTALLEPGASEEGWRVQRAIAEGNRRRPNVLVVRADKPHPRMG